MKHNDTIWTVRNKRDMDRALADHGQFLLASYSSYFDKDNRYVLKHWNTIIARINEDGTIAYFDTGYYSRTTSRFQGQIIRYALSGQGRHELRTLLGSDKLRSITI